MSDFPGVLMLDLMGTTLSREEHDLLQHPQVGGVILFARNIETPAQVCALNAAIRQSRPEILIAVDQEGGRVQRLRQGFTRLPPQLRLQSLFESDAEQALRLSRDLGWLMASEVLAAGFDFSFAPVLDLHTGRSTVIGDRAFASDIDTLVALASAYMEGMHEAGMATTGKHFPGHGSVEADSHLDLPVDERPLDEILRQDLQPFARCLPLLDAVMPAHVLYPAADASCAGFSSYWLQQVLREQLGFKGVIFSDDLVMAAAASAGDMPQRVARALTAGCDMLLVCNDRAAALQALQALDKGQVSPSEKLLSMRGRYQGKDLVSLQTDDRVMDIRQRIGQL
ncbi:beta-N-acetylhexosaminidase [Pseudohongiella spirulinae]|uniref:Beta-hexosaminidase n=1 Tax=Pseudohongiella spirulinae TaxID=1249552 RepID=A0A0S2KED9_9GAMM|nr:beta-N-acetylhexosaminidase [Pseudohongiella spirulinae]ALO46478.1 Beta-hexosaminidase [Pseudohongiella spirulinae]